MNTNTLTEADLSKIDGYWRAANYLSVGQIYLYDNPLLKRPLQVADIKHMLLGHWATTPGRKNFIYAHLNRAIKKFDLNMIYVSGPGHGGPAVVSNTYLEGTYSEIYPHIGQDEAGLQKLFFAIFVSGRHPEPCLAGDAGFDSVRVASWDIRWSHSFGAVFDNPDFDRGVRGGRWRSGDRGRWRRRWHSNKFLNAGDGRRGAADSASQWLQDCEPDNTGADFAGGIGATVSWVMVGRLILWRGMNRQ